MPDSKRPERQTREEIRKTYESIPMNYEQTLDYLFSLQKFGIKLGLSSTENLLAGLGDPQNNIPAVHLAGTNGKGSVGSSITSILKTAGYRVGFFTSPHLVSFRERFVVGSKDGLEMVSREDVVRLTKKVLEVCSPEEPPTFFEFVTAMAFKYFEEQQVDLAVMETGMGGRLDATNLVKPLVGVITNISMEHTEYLGTTLSAIAHEKAGIIKRGLPVVTGEKRPHIRKLFEDVCKENEGMLIALGRDVRCRKRKDGGMDYQGLDLKLADIRLKLKGDHQVRNAALALAVIELLKRKNYIVSESDIRQGYLNVSWPGRAEMFDGPKGKAPLMLDGAHNPAAARALARLVADMDYSRVRLVLGIMSDKDIKGIMGPLLPVVSEVYLTRPQYSRAASVEEMACKIDSFTGTVKSFNDIPSAIETAWSESAAGELVLVTGSLFTVGEARGYLATPA